MGPHSWTPKTYTVNGSWSIQEQAGKRFVKLGEDFQTSPGPDVKLYLSPIPISEIGDRDSINLGGLFLGKLQAFSGAQQYEIPSSTQLDQYKSLVIHCEKYSVVWGGAALS